MEFVVGRHAVGLRSNSTQMAQQSDSAQLTAELAISKDAAEPTSQQMIAAISRHKQVADGKSVYIATSSSVLVFVSKVLTCMSPFWPRN